MYVTEFSARGFKFHSGQHSIATSKNRSVFVCFNVTSRVDIALTVLDHPYVRLVSSVGRALERKSESRGFESDFIS